MARRKTRKPGNTRQGKGPNGVAKALQNPNYRQRVIPDKRGREPVVMHYSEDEWWWTN